MFCKKCGAELPEIGKFCPVCGQKSDDLPADPVSPADPQMASETPVTPVEEQPAQMPVEAQTPEVPPMEPAPDFGEPAPVFPEPSYAPMEDFVPAEPPKKKKGKRILISVLASVLVLALVGGILVYALVFNNPTYKLVKATEKSGEAFTEAFDHCKNLKAACSNLFSRGMGDRFVTRFSLDVDNEGVDIEVNMDTKAKELSGSLRLPTSSNKLLFYGNEDLLAFGVDSYPDENYFLPMKNLGDELVEAGLLGAAETETIETLNRINLFTTYDKEAFQHAHEKEFQALKDSLAVEKSESAIPGTEDALTVYSVSADWSIFLDLYEAQMEESGMLAIQGGNKASLDSIKETFFDPEFRILAGVNGDGFLTALHISNSAGSFAILLEGDQNPWEVIRVSADGETILEISTEITETGFYSKVYGENYSFPLVCDDTAKTISIEGIPDFELHYDSADQGFQLSVQYDEMGYYAMTYEIGVEVRPLTEPIEPLASPTNLLDLSEYELQYVLLDFLQALGLM